MFLLLILFHIFYVHLTVGKINRGRYSKEIKRRDE